MAAPSEILGLPKPAWVTEDVAMLYDMAVKFLEAEIAPKYEDFEKAEIFDRESWLKAGADGKFVDATPHNTVWTVEGDNSVLAVGKPVTITSTDGAGLVFHRTFDVDANYLFTITERVDNTTGADVSLATSSEIVREGTPHVSNFFVQHEGPLGVLGSNNLVLRKYSDLQKDARVTFDNTTGWLGFGDKYWATTVIAEPGQAISPQFLLLDEPFSGIDPIQVLELQRIISDLKRNGIGILITDHNVRETLAVTDRAYIINNGRIFRAGTPTSLAMDPEVRRIYLGESFELGL